MSSPEYRRTWRAKNPESVRASGRRFRAANLESERARNLGYYHRTRNEKPKLAWARCCLKNARKRARERGVPFTVTLLDIVPLALDRCPVSPCGNCDLSFLETTVQRNSPTLDRIDPLVGYVPGNLWVVCFDCNRRMGDNSAEELEALAAAKRKARATSVENPSGLDPVAVDRDRRMLDGDAGA